MFRYEDTIFRKDMYPKLLRRDIGLCVYLCVCVWVVCMCLFLWCVCLYLWCVWVFVCVYAVCAYLCIYIYICRICMYMYICVCVCVCSPFSWTNRYSLHFLVFPVRSQSQLSVSPFLSRNTKKTIEVWMYAGITVRRLLSDWESYVSVFCDNIICKARYRQG